MGVGDPQSGEEGVKRGRGGGGDVSIMGWGELGTPKIGWGSWPPPERVGGFREPPKLGGGWS